MVLVLNITIRSECRMVSLLVVSVAMVKRDALGIEFPYNRKLCVTALGMGHLPQISQDGVAMLLVLSVSMIIHGYGFMLLVWSAPMIADWALMLLVWSIPTN